MWYHKSNTGNCFFMQEPCFVPIVAHVPIVEYTQRTTAAVTNNYAVLLTSIPGIYPLCNVSTSQKAAQAALPRPSSCHADQAIHRLELPPHTHTPPTLSPVCKKVRLKSGSQGRSCQRKKCSKIPDFPHFVFCAILCSSRFSRFFLSKYYCVDRR